MVHRFVGVAVAVLLGMAINKYLIRPLVPASIGSTSKIFG
jgi:hypothetical protein